MKFKLLTFYIILVASSDYEMVLVKIITKFIKMRQTRIRTLWKAQFNN